MHRLKELVLQWPRATGTLNEVKESQIVSSLKKKLANVDCKCKNCGLKKPKRVSVQFPEFKSQITQTDSDSELPSIVDPASSKENSDVQVISIPPTPSLKSLQEHHHQEVVPAPHDFTPPYLKPVTVNNSSSAHNNNTMTDSSSNCKTCSILTNLLSWKGEIVKILKDQKTNVKTDELYESGALDDKNTGSSVQMKDQSSSAVKFADYVHVVSSNTSVKSGVRKVKMYDGNIDRNYGSPPPMDYFCRKVPSERIKTEYDLMFEAIQDARTVKKHCRCGKKALKYFEQIML